MLSADTERVLPWMLLRQTELAKNELMKQAEELVNTHFEQTANKDNTLTSSQLKNLEGVAFTALSVSDIHNFIRKQANKEDSSKPERKKWTHNDLHQRLPEAIHAAIETDAGFVFTEFRQKADELMEKTEKAEVEGVNAETWLTKERRTEVKINMVRSFLTYFATYYLTRKIKNFGGAEEDER